MAVIRKRTALHTGLVAVALAAGVLAAPAAAQAAPAAPAAPKPSAAQAFEPGTSHGAGEVARSKNAVLTLQSDGNLVLEHVSGGVLWATGTYGNPGATVTFQQDGNLVVYSAAGKALWAAGSYGNPGARLDLQSDGNLVVYRQDGSAAWSTGTWMVDTAVYATWQIGSGNWTWSPNAILAMERTGKLSIRDRNTLVERWSTATWGPGAYARMQSDGNFVVYGKDGGEGRGGALWSTGTWNNPGAHLLFRPDGNLVLLAKDSDAVLWQSATAD
ncbi:MULTISPECIES: hypothetical protein [unclassified Streptomyces]|uniref:hypothetical protein n=1 Tax=unclassified Streptomyces TaxID=2593676 RepID=UPI002E2F3F86|nr:MULTISPECIES: hypothetical protein [unclassified Streptomyces]